MRKQIRNATRAMKRIGVIAALVLGPGFIDSAAAVDAEGRFPKYAFSLHSGGAFYTGFEDDFSLEDPAFLVGMGAETWLTPRWAARMRVRYSNTNLEFDDRVIGDVGTVPVDVNVMYRPFAPKGPQRFIPFISAGIGAVHYDGDDIRDAAGAPVDFDDGWKAAGVVSIGMDIIPNTPTKAFGAFIRLELSDHIVFDSPLRGSDDAVHNIAPTLGMNVIFPLQPTR